MESRCVELRRAPGHARGGVMTGPTISVITTGHFTARRRRDANDGWAVAGAARRPIRANAKSSQYRGSPPTNVVPTILGMIIGVALVIGWLNRDDNGLSPDSGVGYWLGVVGSSLMLASLLYPLRKRVQCLRGI